jgi:peroxiredoxin
MTIKVGDSIPAMKIMQGTSDGPKELDTAEFFKGRTVVLFGVPGAFTPTCSARHLPGYVEHAATFLRNGVDEVVCVSVNDAFVMAAWGKSAHADGKVTMIADGNGDFSKALGLTFDGSAYGMGIRGQRFSMIVRDGKVAELNIEPPGAFGVSSAEHLLGQLA